MTSEELKEQLDIISDILDEIREVIHRRPTKDYIQECADKFVEIASIVAECDGLNGDLSK